MYDFYYYKASSKTKRDHHLCYNCLKIFKCNNYIPCIDTCYCIAQNYDDNMYYKCSSECAEL